MGEGLRFFEGVAGNLGLRMKKKLQIQLLTFPPHGRFPNQKETSAERIRRKLSFGPVSPGGTPILGHIRDVRPEWVSFPGRKSADGCKLLTKNLRMGHNFDMILPGNGWFSSKLNKTYCSLVKFYCK